MFALTAPVDDGLLIPEVGSWTTDKHHFLGRYVDAFTNSMKDKPWNGLHYIDLFASAGIERIKESGALEWGSSLIAAQSPHPFTRLHLCEWNRERFAALKSRVERFELNPSPELICGDANVAIRQVAASLPPRSLSLAFLDPHGLHLHFETLRVLAGRRVDLIIFFPDHLDALRNWRAYYHDKLNSNLDLVLGTNAWRERLKATPNQNMAQALSDLYKEQIRMLGYSKFEEERISLPNGRFLYKLIFCSASDAGLRIWRNVSMRKPDGQGTLNFGE